MTDYTFVTHVYKVTNGNLMIFKRVKNFRPPKTRKYGLLERKKPKQELKEVLKFPMRYFGSQFEIRTFIFQNTLDYGTLINKEIESISNNFDILC